MENLLPTELAFDHDFLFGVDALGALAGSRPIDGRGGIVELNGIGKLDFDAVVVPDSEV